jgi:GT2 family glycosyltransferase
MVTTTSAERTTAADAGVSAGLFNRGPVDVAISIGSLGDFEVLKRCLESLAGNATPALRYEIWVVYNGPGGDGTVERIRASFPEVRLIVEPGPLGYCATHNLVLRQCHARYVLILDDDTIVARGALPRMIRFMDAHPDVGMSGCRTLNPDGSFQVTYGLYPSFRTELRNIFIADSFWPAHLYRDPGRMRDVDWLNGSFMLVRSAAIQQVGILDERYYTVVCEPDWCYRIRKAGWRVVYVPDAEIVHVGNLYSRKNKLTARNHATLVRYHVNRYYFFRKHYGAWAAEVLRPVMIAGSALRLVLYGLRFLRSRGADEAAGVRVRTFGEVLKLSLGRAPHRMPAHLNGPPARPAARSTR